jgi:hypothetical protein
MASFVLRDTSSTTARTLADGEFGFISDDSALEVDGDAVTASGEVALAVYGRLFGSESALDQDDGFLVLQVGRDARVGAGDSDTIVLDDGDGAFVDNDGRINSNEDALDLRGTGAITILNDGLLRGDSDGIVTESVGALTRIVNRGTIAGRDDGGIDHLGGDALVINRGTIVGVDYGFDGEDGREELENFGSIEGGVFMYAQDDFVSNRGEIDSVELGGGDDVYLGLGAGRAGSVDGGGGRDTLVSSRADDLFNGGGAGDFLVFLPRGGDDRVFDFAGADKIDLSALDLDSFGADVRDRLEERPNGTLIDFSDRGLTIFLRGVEADDLRASDFIFELMVM